MLFAGPIGSDGSLMEHLDLDTLVLKSGSHTPDSEFCVMEAVAYMAHEPWSDHPECASKVITSFCQAWNDGMNDEDRQMLKPFIPRIVGTKASAAIENKRSWMALDWYCRVSTPVWLRAAGLVKEAEAIEATKPITSAASAKKAQAALDAARKAGDAAWDAAWDAAGDATWDALRPTVVELQKSALNLLDRMIALSAGGN